MDTNNKNTNTNNPNSTKRQSNTSTRHYGFSQDDLYAEIRETLGWLEENHTELVTSTIAAYLSLLFNLTSLIEDCVNRRFLFGALVDFENRNNCKPLLHI